MGLVDRWRLLMAWNPTDPGPVCKTGTSEFDSHPRLQRYYGIVAKLVYAVDSKSAEIIS